MDTPAHSPFIDEDVLKVVHLMGRIISAPDEVVEKRHLLLDGLCKLMHATSWFWCLNNSGPRPPPLWNNLESGRLEKQRFVPKNLSGTEEIICPFCTQPGKIGNSYTDFPSQTISEKCFARSADDTSQMKSNIGAMMTFQRPLDGATISTIRICRKIGQPHFSDRDTRIAQMIFSEIPWLHSHSFSDQNLNEIPRLSPRHATVLNLLRKGLPRKKIAEHLHISIHTVHGYSNTILKQFGVHSQAELMRRFTKNSGST